MSLCFILVELTSVSVWSLSHMIYMISTPITTPPMASSLLNADLAFVFVFARAVRHWLWYRASRAVISPSDYFANNPWFWIRVAISHYLLSDGIVLDLATSPPNLSPMKHVFNGAIDVANLDCVLHWLVHSYVSLCLHLLALSSVKAQVNNFFAMMLNGFVIQPQCLPHHLTGLGQVPQVVKRFKEIAWHFRWRCDIQSHSSWYLSMAKHKHFYFSNMTYDTTLPFHGNFHHIWSAGRWIKIHLYDWISFVVHGT